MPCIPYTICSSVSCLLSTAAQKSFASFLPLCSYTFNIISISRVMPLVPLFSSCKSPNLLAISCQFRSDRFFSSQTLRSNSMPAGRGMRRALVDSVLLSYSRCFSITCRYSSRFSTLAAQRALGEGAV